MKKFFLIIFILIGIFGGLFFFVENRESNKASTLYEGFNFISESSVIDKDDFSREDGQFFLSFDYIKEYIDEGISFDKATNEIRIKNALGTKIIKLDEKKADFNGHEILLRDSAKNVNGKIMIPIEAFIYDYPVKLSYDKDQRLLILDRLDEPYSIGKTITTVNLREGANKSTPLIKKIEEGTELKIYHLEHDYYRVRELNGYAGFVHSDYLADIKEVSPKVNNHKKSKPLNITWDYTYAEHSQEKINQIINIPGLDVIVPTWFSIRNELGDLIDRGNTQYVNNYKALGIDVWGYLDNSFDPEITRKALSNDITRKKIIDKTIELCKKYNMNGLNIDFENTYTDDRDLITKFVEELSEVTKENNILLSVDVTPQISSDVKNEPYDRKALVDFADYICVMTYDQHWAKSEEAGSVAEFPWVEGSINVLFRNIPREKMILGVPLYMRLWTEENGKVSSKTISMNECASIISSRGLSPKWQEDIGQYYVEYTDGSATNKIWIENKDSIKRKVSLVNKYKLAGLASWRLGFESPDIWPAINDEIFDLEY
ncbi:glycosyl hydrolase family 18 protein [Peptoniphilus raoultii]|uniref:glycosyl hydrolase family 18 protein n=2 Tax=Peptoniphilus TaxID=162289 RepID=UPI0008D91EBB|nr:glycosyl hydrolase family 18 protein [Peptoniphilus raoultii]